MKGLITSWLYCRKSYFIIAVLFFLLTCLAMIIAIPLMNFEENEQLEPIAAFGAFILGFLTMMIWGESLGKDLEDMLKTGFANYVLTAGISKQGFVNVLLAENLICCFFSLVTGTAVMALYSCLIGEAMTGEMWLLVPMLALFIHSLDFSVTPLVIKLKNSEKASFGLGLVIGVIIVIFMTIFKVFDGEMLKQTLTLDPPTAVIVIGALILLYIPSYYITLHTVKRGDIC